MAKSLSTQEQTTLKDFMETRFKIVELEDVVFDLGIPSGNFGENIPKNKLVRELIEYCIHHNLLDCLIVEITRRRDDAHKILDNLISRFNSCNPRKKIQVILDKDELEIPVEQFREMIASVCPNVHKDDVVVISAVRGSLLILIGLPDAGCKYLISQIEIDEKSSSGSRENNFYELKTSGSIIKIRTIVEFDDLSAGVQKTWRFAAFKYPAPNYGFLDQLTSWIEITQEIKAKEEHRPEIIILVEEDKKVLDAISDILELSGFVVIKASSCSEGMDIMEREHIDRAIIDYKLQEKFEDFDFGTIKVIYIFEDDDPQILNLFLSTTYIEVLIQKFLNINEIKRLLR